MTITGTLSPRLRGFLIAALALLCLVTSLRPVTTLGTGSPAGLRVPAVQAAWVTDAATITRGDVVDAAGTRSVLRPGVLPRHVSHIYVYDGASESRAGTLALRVTEVRSSGADTFRLSHAGRGVRIRPPPDPAAEAADGAIAFGPGTEKAWSVLDRVASKGAPLPGYKGGSVFKNLEGRLPGADGAGNSISYREWDVNPYVKGVDRGPERLVTGSGGSAYYTGDHYGSFLQFWGAP